MKISWLIFTQYFRRALLDRLGILMLLLLPIGLILLQVFIIRANNEPMLINGYDAMATQVSIIIMVMFQFFGGMYINEWIYDDFRGANCWRLFSAPVSKNKFIFSAAAASWLITVVQALIIIIISAFLLNAYWSNFVFWIPTLFMLAAVSQFMYIIIALFANKKKTAEAIGHVIIFSMALIGGALIRISNSVHEILDKIPTPFNLGVQAIYYSGSIGDDMRRAVTSLLILAAYLAVLIILAVIIGRRRKI